MHVGLVSCKSIIQVNHVSITTSLSTWILTTLHFLMWHHLILCVTSQRRYDGTSLYHVTSLDLMCDFLKKLWWNFTSSRTSLILCVTSQRSYDGTSLYHVTSLDLMCDFPKELWWNFIIIWLVDLMCDFPKELWWNFTLSCDFTWSYVWLPKGAMMELHYHMTSRSYVWLPSGTMMELHFIMWLHLILCVTSQRRYDGTSLSYDLSILCVTSQWNCDGTSLYHVTSLDLMCDFPKELWWHFTSSCDIPWWLFYACLGTCCSHFLTTTAGVDLHYRHASKLPVCRTPGRCSARRGC